MRKAGRPISPSAKYAKGPYRRKMSPMLFGDVQGASREITVTMNTSGVIKGARRDASISLRLIIEI